MAWIAVAAMVPKPARASMLSHPLSVQLTPQQLRWLDALRARAGLTRSAMLRTVLQQAMERDSGRTA